MTVDGGTYLSLLVEALREVERVDIPVSILGNVTSSTDTISIDLHFGVQTCQLCGFKPPTGRAKKCGRCEDRLPSKRFPWRVKAEGSPDVLSSLKGIEPCRFRIDPSVGGIRILRSLHRHMGEAVTCWVGALDVLGAAPHPAMLQFGAESVPQSLLDRFDELDIGRYREL